MADLCPDKKCCSHESSTTFTHVVAYKGCGNEEFSIAYTLCRSEEEARVIMLRGANMYVEMLRKFCSDKTALLKNLGDAGKKEDTYSDEDMTMFETMLQRNLVQDDVGEATSIFVPHNDNQDPCDDEDAFEKGYRFDIRCLSGPNPEFSDLVTAWDFK